MTDIYVEVACGRSLFIVLCDKLKPSKMAMSNAVAIYKAFMQSPNDVG